MLTVLDKLIGICLIAGVALLVIGTFAELEREMQLRHQRELQRRSRRWWE